MPDQPTVTIEVVDAHSGTPSVVTLDGRETAWRIRLQSLPGALATQLPVLVDGKILYRVEVASDRVDMVEINLAHTADHGIAATSERQVFILPAAPQYAPLPLIRPEAGPKLDLCFIVDATTRWVDPTASTITPELLLANKSVWAKYVTALVEFGQGLLHKYPDCRAGVLAFGDHPIEGLDAIDLRPEFALRPSAPRLTPWTAPGIEHALQSMTPSPGGDLVDALGDALAAVSKIWRIDARKLLLVLGDSPGFSVLQHPRLPPTANGIARDDDVFERAADLHQKGVEIITVHCQPDQRIVDGLGAGQFVDYTREQYRQLASHASLAFDAAAFAPATASRLVAEWSQPIGRGSCPGVLVDVTAIKAN